MEYFYKQGIVVEDTLQWDWSESPIIRLNGKIFFDHAYRFLPDKLEKRLCLNVSKRLRIFRSSNNRRLIKTEMYSYNLNYDGKKKSEIFRYDNFDVKPRRGHSHTFHCHRFEPPGREIMHSPFEIDPEDFPTLADVIWEAYESIVRDKEK